MSKPKHTPGPWTVGAFNKKQYTYDVRTEGEANRVAAAQLMGPYRQGESQANARLIAAAPDLLNVLTDLVQSLDGIGLNETDAPVSADDLFEFIHTRLADWKRLHTKVTGGGSNEEV